MMLKRQARKGKGQRAFNPSAGTIDEMIDPGATVRKSAKGTKDMDEGIGMLDVSVTLEYAGMDVPAYFFSRLVDLCKSETVSGAVALERGSELDNLHCHAMFRTRIRTPRQVNAAIKKCFDWGTKKPASVMLVCKALKNTKLHCFEGVLGYCLKDAGKVHYKICLHNVSERQIEVGKDLYLMYGAGDIKNLVVLDNRNLLHRAGHYVNYHGRKYLTASLIYTVCRMLRSGKFILSSQWIFPTNTAFISEHRVKAAWRITLNPRQAMPSDVRCILFGIPVGMLPVERVGKARRRYWDDVPCEGDDDEHFVDEGHEEYLPGPEEATSALGDDFISLGFSDYTMAVG